MTLPRSSIVVILLVSSALLRVTQGYIQCLPGTLNVILSAPHGGSEKPDEIPNRVAGCLIDGECVYTHDCGTPDLKECSVSKISDMYTKELTLLLADELEHLRGKRPHIVINNLHRSKMDANRERNEATFDDPIAVTTYDWYHRCIAIAKMGIEWDQTVGNRGLFVDIHGQGHPNNWAELGYAIPKSQLNSGDFTADDSSIRSLASSSSQSFENILRGSESFGHFLEQEGYNAVPSPNHHEPGSEKYFSGGYNTKKYGSRDGGSVDAIQIESSKQQRSDAERANYAVALAKAIDKYLNTHY